MEAKQPQPPKYGQRKQVTQPARVDVTHGTHHAAVHTRSLDRDDREAEDELRLNN